MQAGGRRFDPVILHQQLIVFAEKKSKLPSFLDFYHFLFVNALNIKAALQKAALMLIDIYRSIGCSLKIHRVELALLVETAHS